jgi:glucan phosphoethanolaminetransferase (alkaline phosphatase superfamily)
MFWGKLSIITSGKLPVQPGPLALVLLPDVLFVGAIMVLISFLYVIKPSVSTARCALFISVVVSGWSVLNAGWLMRSGAQLQPGVIKVMLRDFKELWPFVRPFVTGSLWRSVGLIIVGVVVFGIASYLLIRPRKVVGGRVHHVRWMTAKALVVVALFLVQSVSKANSEPSFATGVLSFSSHEYALACFLHGGSKNPRPTVVTRNIARVGERHVVGPALKSDDLPNIILVLLESISYEATSLCDPALDTMPNLTRLAHEGVEFTLTRVPVAHTTQAYWATLTSSTPIIQAGHIEAVPVAQPYEGLPSLLAKAGYRSAFFEMSKGSFECAPGFFSNLAFDWAWFRENLEDPSAHIGLVSGDDCRMLDPAFKWAMSGSEPFLLMMITTVAHEPYDVPAWFGETKDDLYDKYLQAVRFTDYFIGQLCNRLREHGLENNTLLCVLGDHGSWFRFQLNRARWIPYEEIIRVPWVIHWPGHIQAGQKIDWPCSQLDVAPTILKLIGFDIIGSGFEGKDAFTPSASNRRLYFSTWFADSPLGFVEGNRKVVYWPYLDKVFEYNLAVDPDEENPTIPSGGETDKIRHDIMNWRQKSQIEIDPKRCTEQLLFSHWQTFSTGSFAGAYYVP